jgi:asparagine synthase (glutamine-hydrolysing)
MCGICGYFNVDQPAEENNEIMLRMLNLIAHRGPDDAGIIAVNRHKKIFEVPAHHPAPFKSPANLMLGFRRLSILDVSINGHQPMLSMDGQVALLMNGEIYNAFDFRDDLIREGYVFRSTTDTEVVLNLYLKYGFNAMIQLLNGMFGIAIYDARIGKLFLARDRFGIKPLYLLRDQGHLAFASEIKAFKALPGFRFELDSEKIDEFLIFRNLIHHTLFKGIVNLTPGMYYSVHMSGHIDEHLYWDSLEAKDTTLPTDLVVAQLDNELRLAVQRQMMSDVKLGCQLSGGVDSTLVSWYAAHQVPAGQLETVSIIFNEKEFSEEPYIDYVGSKLQLRTHKFTLDPAYYLERFDDATWHYEQPINHPNTVGIYLLSEEARKHVTVLLSGEGGDEVLAGYSRFAKLSRSPWFSREFLGLVKSSRHALLSFMKYYKSARPRMVMASAFGTPVNASKLWPDFNFDRAITPRLSLSNHLNPKNVRDVRQYELCTYLPDLLMRQDKMSMAHSIENRVPFLDNELVKTALCFPAESLIGKDDDGQLRTKLSAKLLCASYFGRDFAFRKKESFSIPIRRFMNNKLFQKKWQDQLLPGIKQRGLFEPKAFADTVDNIQSVNFNQMEMIWQMYSFESWAQQYLD